MTPLQQLESRIRELVPSTAVRLNRCKGCGYGVDYCQKTLACPQFEEHEILQLHHVLQAIQLYYGFNDLMYYAGMRGGDTVQLLKICGAGKECDWNLPLPLSGQSEETIKFLLEILK